MTALMLVAIVIFSSLLRASATGALSEGNRSHWQLNRTMDFTIAIKNNETGHWITKVWVNSASPRLPKRWNVDFKHSVTTSEGMQLFRLEGILTAPPPRPDDYTLFPGIGYYKIHKTHHTFDDASALCSREGGHLGIVNSDAEANVYKSLIKKEKIHAVFIGFHDRTKEGEFITIFRDPLNSTGFNKWNPGQPDDAHGNEDCGCFREEGTLCDYTCEKPFPFICEYDLAWV